jgi:hypothetical protein
MISPPSRRASSSPTFVLPTAVGPVITIILGLAAAADGAVSPALVAAWATAIILVRTEHLAIRPLAVRVMRCEEDNMQEGGGVILTQLHHARALRLPPLAAAAAAAAAPSFRAWVCMQQPSNALVTGKKDFV